MESEGGGPLENKKLVLSIIKSIMIFAGLIECSIDGFKWVFPHSEELLDLSIDDFEPMSLNEREYFEERRKIF